MNNANKVKLGAFILASAALIVGCFFAIGVMQIFEPKFQAMTVLNTSVEGLSVGSPVKYMGVPVGRITRIAMRDSDGYIDVYFNIFPSSIDMIQNDQTIHASGSYKLTNVMRRKKLSCFLNASGIMGGSFLELGVSDKIEYALPNLEVSPPEDVFYIKSRTSHVSNVIQNISQTLEQLTKVNFVMLADKLNNTLDNANTIFNKAEVGDTLKRFNRISKDVEYSAKNLRIAFSEEQVKKMLKTIDYLEDGTRKLHKALPPEKLKELSDSLSAFLKEAREFLDKTDKSREAITGDFNQLKIRLIQSLVKVDRILKEFSVFINNLEEDPNQLIRGRMDKPIFNNKSPEIK
jgi:ABC-type transporter Mla subunit MlaD